MSAEVLQMPGATVEAASCAAETQRDAGPLLKALHREFIEWHHKPDLDVVDFTVAVYLSVHENDRPLWGMITASPSTNKTGTAKHLRDKPNVHMLSQITQQTFASGLKNMGDKVSLLNRLPNPCLLVVKDFTTILQSASDTRSKVLAQMRELADGNFDAGYGTGSDVKWGGQLGMLACCTTVIDSFSPFMQTLGERFIYIRPVAAGDDFREKAAMKALNGGGHESSKDGSLSKAVGDYLAGIRTNGRAADVVIPDTIKARIVALADYVALARTVPHRHWRSREIENLAEPEGTPRLAGQFGLLSRCLALARQHPKVTEADMQTVTRVGMDTLTLLKRRLLEALGEDWRPAKDVAATMRMSVSATVRHLEDAASVAGGLVDMPQSGAWRLSDKAIGLLANIGGSGA